MLKYLTNLILILGLLIHSWHGTHLHQILTLIHVSMSHHHGDHYQHSNHHQHSNQHQHGETSSVKQSSTNPTVSNTGKDHSDQHKHVLFSQLISFDLFQGKGLSTEVQCFPSLLLLKTRFIFTLVYSPHLEAVYRPPIS